MISRVNPRLVKGNDLNPVQEIVLHFLTSLRMGILSTVGDPANVGFVLQWGKPVWEIPIWDNFSHEHVLSDLVEVNILWMHSGHQCNCCACTALSV